MKKIIYIAILFALVVYVYQSFFSDEDEFITTTVDELCGEYPLNYVSPEIGNNPNYVFISDPNFESKRLQDEVGNVVFVNSFIECEHYVLGGWNFIPNINFTSNDRSFDYSECIYSQNLNKYFNKDDKVYIEDIPIREILSLNWYQCLGKIKTLSANDSYTSFTIYYSRIGYFLFAQIFPFIFLFMKNRIRSNILIIFVVFYQLAIQLIFNYNIGLNLLNSVSLFTTLLIIFLLFESQHEDIK